MLDTQILNRAKQRPAFAQSHRTTQTDFAKKFAAITTVEQKNNADANPHGLRRRLLLQKNYGTAKRQCREYPRSSDSACNFAGTKATSTCINSLRRAVHYSLDPFDVGLPGSVGTSVRMGNLDAERHILTAIFAFCHVSHLLLYSVTDDMITDCKQKSKLFFIFYCPTQCFLQKTCKKHKSLI